ncbi:MAG: FAD-dependent oxidoreductase [Pseudomonadota bacterium]
MPLFDNSLYHYEEPQPSWWEASVDDQRVDGEAFDGNENCEVAVIGGGYTGLSAAYHLAKDYNLDVRVLEAGHIGWGASGRNGGFCCMGGTMLSVQKQIRKFGIEETRKFYRAQAEAVELVRHIASDENIGFDEQGDGELVVAEKPGHCRELEEECKLKQNMLGLDCSMISKEAFREQGYDAPHQHGAILEKPGFALHPLKYCLGLGEAAKRKGAKLHPHSEVIAWYKQDGKHVLETAAGGTLIAENVIVACNGFMPEKLNKGIAGRALPLQSQIIVTRPLTDGELAAHNWKMESPAINSRNVYFYYRMLPDRHFLIGGRGDFQGTKEGAEMTAEKLRQSMVELWPEWREVEIEYSWRGFVCFTSALRPAIGRLPEDPSVYFGFGYHGNGVNNATWTGRELARWLAGNNDRTNPVPTHLPAIMRGMTPKFPFPSFRRYYAMAGVGWHRFKDMIDG